MTHPPVDPAASPEEPDRTDGRPRFELDDPDDLAPPRPLDLHGELLPPAPAERSITKRVVFLSVGSILVVVGVLLTLTPIVSGWPLWVVGLVLLSRASDRVRRVVNYGDRKLPGKVRSGLRWARDKSRLVPGQAPPPSAP
jgi:hypothetical protein